VTFILKEGLRRFASHAFGQLDAEIVDLLGLQNIVLLDEGRHVGTRVPPRQQSVGRLGQCKAWDIVVYIFNGGVVVRSGPEVWGVVRCTGFVMHVECIFGQPRRHRRQLRSPAFVRYFLAISWRHPRSVWRHEVANEGYCEYQTTALKKHLAIQMRSHVAHLFARHI